MFMEFMQMMVKYYLKAKKILHKNARKKSRIFVHFSY